jgi:uncharacterized protein (DUF1810 family)
MGDGARDAFDLARFIAAQGDAYAAAISELKAGRKRTHWIWYIFPQLRGLGTSEMARVYGIVSLEEARAYLAHPILGYRLRECVQAMNAVSGATASAILGDVDAVKFRSCLTLFHAAQEAETIFAEALRKFYAGAPDDRTLELLSRRPERH